ncbi:MAG: hypothetical protein RLW61_22250 [Gammaproteobacteria bacterium]
MELEALAAILPPTTVAATALGVLVVEGVVLAAVALHRDDRGALVGTLLALLPGACLLVAVLFALGPRPWPGVVLALAAALPLHLLDVAARWRRRP